jgi:flagellar protein FliO/FliZ
VLAIVSTTGAYAAPQAQAPTAAVPGLGSALEMLLALALVLAAVFALAWLMRRLKSFPVGRQALLRTDAELAVGEKERVVLLAVGQQKLLLGVSAGGISLLHTFGADAPGLSADANAGLAASAGAAPASFAAILRRSVGLKS